MAILASCTTPPASTTATASPTSPAPATEAYRASPTPALSDLTVAAAGDVRGGHALVLQANSSSTAGVASKMTLWDVPLDGTAPRRLVAYTRIGSPFTEYDVTSLSRQLSSDGRYLVLSDALDVAGSGLAIVDLVAGTARRVAFDGIANQPCWSPDGQRIAFRGAEVAGALTKDTGVWVVSAAGGAARQVATSDIATGSGATLIYGWADGRNVLFQQHGLHVVDTVTGSAAAIPGTLSGVTIAARVKRPAVALVFDDQGSQPPVGHVEVRDSVAAAGRVVARYGPAEGTFLSEPRWRPGATDDILLFYAFGQGVAERDELVIVDGVTGTRRAIPTPTYVRAAAWSADGRQIIYASLGELRVRNADGSDDRVVFSPATPPADSSALVVGVTAFAPH